jgi:hypothetical protein
MPKYRPNEFLDAQFVFPIKPLQGNQNNPKRFSNIFIVPSRNSIIRQEKNIIPPSYEKQAKTVPKSFLEIYAENNQASRLLEMDIQIYLYLEVCQNIVPTNF